MCNKAICVFHTTHGFSIELPSGDTWIIKEKDNMVFSYKKVPQKGFHTFYAAAAEITVDQKFDTPQDFLDYIKQTKETGFSKEDYVTIKTNYLIKPEIAPFCVFYHQKYKDYATEIKGKMNF